VSFAGAVEIERSLEIAAARAGDLNGAIYGRLFVEFPETEALFVMDRDRQVRGSMLAHVFETIFDFIGERRYAHRFVGAEIVTHEGYGVASDAFAAFFAIVRDEVRAACGQDWTSEMEGAWQALLAQLAQYVARPEA
jgi:hemoglobin-like flavoprotein